MKSFFSLLISFALISLGDVANLAIANNISFAAIGTMGAYYTINWLTNEFTQFGAYAYRIERRDEWQYAQIALVCGLVIGIIVAALSRVIPLAFGIDDEQREMLTSMLCLFIAFQPVKAFAATTSEMLRLRGMLSAYRNAVILFYAGSIPLNLLLFFTWHQIVGIVIAQIVGNLAMGAYAAYRLAKDHELKFAFVTGAQLRCVMRYGAPLVGERLIQRIGFTVYGICASYLPAEIYAIHSICLQAVYMGDIGDSAYSAALLVLVPDKKKEEASRERYKSERIRMIAYRRETAWVAVLFSFGASYLAAFIMHAEVDLAAVLWFTFFYAFSFIPMCSSTPGKDFLTIQKHPIAVMFSTMCGVPAYILIPLAAVFLLPPESALYAFGLTGTVQICIRALLYNHFIHKMDTDHGVNRHDLAVKALNVKLNRSEAARELSNVPKDDTKKALELTKEDDPQTLIT